MRPPWIYAFFFPFSLILLCKSSIAQLHHYSRTANLSTTWTNNASFVPSTSYFDGSQIRAVLLPHIYGPQFACGFFCNGECTTYIFAIFTTNFFRKEPDSLALPPQVVWSANRDYPVKDNAVLNLTAAGELVLQDVNGSKVWNSNTSGKSVVGMNFTDAGNLVLFDVDGKVVWQSFDHPTDCLLVGQKLFEGHKLVPSVSPTNWRAQQGLYSLQVTNKGFFGFVGLNPAQVYYTFWSSDTEKTSKERSYVQFLNGNFSYFIHSTEPSDPDGWMSIHPANSIQYMQLMPDGHLKVFKWEQWWMEAADLLTGRSGECGYPLACGRNGICSGNDTCSCPPSTSPGKDYFRALNDSQPSLGCEQITPLNCNATLDQHFIAVENVTYFTSIADMVTLNMEDCKQACMDNCSCKAALFRYNLNSSTGNCFLPSELFTMKNVDYQQNASTFLKVQDIRSSPLSPSPSPSATPDPLPKKETRFAIVVGCTIGSIVFLLVLVLGFIIFVVHKRKRKARMEEEHLDEVPGMPTRFSYEELKVATMNFCKKLGQGGFGSVFEGTLEDRSKIAVKRLEGLTHVNKSFLAEVESVGSIHHVNLVRLIGFCASKSQRLLVYELMGKGSLDRWIYCGDREYVLSWECRKKIVVDIAKGLAYLHENCRQKIIHLDIKPQNILLDNDFNAKIADFGLSKLVDRNQSHVMTIRRGTLGYMAPEWLSSVITEKVDIYSFGMVLLEILCGRKNFDKSEVEERWQLLSVFQRGWQEGKLLDIVDRYSEDMQAHGVEVVEMMKVASWCLQTDFTRRPSMSVVIKVLEGLMEAESNLDYNFTYPRPQRIAIENEIDLTLPLPSFLSGPR